MADQLRDLKPGEPLTAAMMNLIIRELRQLRISVAPPLTLSTTAGNQCIGISDLRPIRLFELDGTLTAGGSATASLMIWNGSDWADGGDTRTLYDSIGTFSGVTGNRVWAFYCRENGRWEILQIEC